MTLQELRNLLDQEKHYTGTLEIELGRKCSSPEIIGIYEENGMWFVYETGDRGDIAILDKGSEAQMTKAIYRRILKKEKRLTQNMGKSGDDDSHLLGH